MLLSVEMPGIEELRAQVPLASVASSLERLERALLAAGDPVFSRNLANPALRHQVLGEPVAELESRPPAGLAVELESDPHLERLEALGQVAADVQDAVEQLAVDDLREVGVVVDPNVGSAATTIVHRWWPPGRTSHSISPRGSEQPIGPHHAARWSGSVNA